MMVHLLYFTFESVRDILSLFNESAYEIQQYLLTMHANTLAGHDSIVWLFAPENKVYGII